jgi:hypothetical protein
VTQNVHIDVASVTIDLLVLSSIYVPQAANRANTEEVNSSPFYYHTLNMIAGDEQTLHVTTHEEGVTKKTTTANLFLLYMYLFV